MSNTENKKALHIPEQASYTTTTSEYWSLALDLFQMGTYMGATINEARGRGLTGNDMQAIYTRLNGERDRLYNDSVLRLGKRAKYIDQRVHTEQKSFLDEDTERDQFIVGALLARWNANDVQLHVPGLYVSFGISSEKDGIGLINEFSANRISLMLKDPDASENTIVLTSSLSNLRPYVAEAIGRSPTPEIIRTLLQAPSIREDVETSEDFLIRRIRELNDIQKTFKATKSTEFVRKEELESLKYDLTMPLLKLWAERKKEGNLSEYPSRIVVRFLQDPSGANNHLVEIQTFIAHRPIARVRLLPPEDGKRSELDAYLSEAGGYDYIDTRRNRPRS